MIFVGLYISFFLLATLLMTFGKIDLKTALFSVATTLGGIRPGLGLTGPMSSYADLPSFNKIVLMACMLFGRLEFYTILLLFVPKFWRRT